MPWVALSSARCRVRVGLCCPQHSHERGFYLSASHPMRLNNVIYQHTYSHENIYQVFAYKSSLHQLRFPPFAAVSCDAQTSMELPTLLCMSLRALLLVMLGHRDAAVTVLEGIPAIVEVQSGGNPAVARALPLSWDALLIAAALSFLLGQGQTYRRLRTSIELATEVPPAACWTYCLPDPGSDPCDYVSHRCDSSSNICTIMCDIASKTGFGQRPFYPDEQLLLRPPSVALSPNHRHEGYPQGDHRYGYGAGGMAMRRRPSEQWSEGGGGGGRGGDASEGRFARAGEGEGAAAAPNADWRAAAGSSESGGTPKRRKILPVDGGDAPEAADAVSEAGQLSPEPPQNDALAGGGGTAAASFRENARNDDYALFMKEEDRRVYGGEGEPEEEDGLGLTRGLHNMSLSRLSVALPGGGVASAGFHEDHGPLGRVPSEGIMDLGSTIGSFSIDPSGGGEVGGHQGGEYDGAFAGEAAAGGGRRNHRRVSSFSTFSSALCRSGSSVNLRDHRSSHGGCRSRDASFEQSSDLGHDIVGVATDGFIDEEGNDICGKMLSVDSILGNMNDITGGNTAENARKGGPGAGGGGSNSNGNRQSGGAGAVASVHEQQSSISRAIAAVRASPPASAPRPTSPADVGATFMTSSGRADGHLTEKGAMKGQREYVRTVSTQMQASRQSSRELWVREEHR